MQGALQCLVGISQLGGLQFMTRRLQTEAWPVLQHLLTHGVPQQPDPGYSSGDLRAVRLRPYCCMLMLQCCSAAYSADDVACNTSIHLAEDLGLLLNCCCCIPLKALSEAACSDHTTESFISMRTCLGMRRCNVRSYWCQA